VHLVKEGTTQLTPRAWVVICSCFPDFEVRKNTAGYFVCCRSAFLLSQLLLNGS